MCQVVSISDPEKALSLIALAAGKWRLSLEESWYHERPEVRNPDRRWYEIIPCHGGAFIGLYAETLKVVLQLYTPKVKNARLIWEVIKNKPGVWADFHLDGEVVIFFPAELLDKVAEMAKAKRRRRLSEEHKAKPAEGVKAHRFKSKNHGSNDEENGANLEVLHVP